MTHRPGRLSGLALAGIAVLSLTGCGAVSLVVGAHEPPAAITTNAAVSIERAKAVVTRVFTAARQADGGGPNADSARDSAYGGEALVAAKARAKLAANQPTIVDDSPALAPEQPGLLAVSRGTAFPRAIVAQTVPAAGSLPVLHLLTSPDVATPYRIQLSATMLPTSAVKRFDPLSKGSPAGDAVRGLAVTPDELLAAYARGLAYPGTTVTDAPYLSDAFLTQVRDNAARQAKAVAVQAAFVQTHRVLPASTYAVQQAGGDALVFGVVERSDTFSVKKGQTIGAPTQFTTFVPGRTKITTKATMTTLELVVFSVPKGTGKAMLVAADDQVVAAAGS